MGQEQFPFLWLNGFIYLVLGLGYEDCYAILIFTVVCFSWYKGALFYSKHSLNLPCFSNALQLSLYLVNILLKHLQSYFYTTKLSFHLYGIMK